MTAALFEVPCPVMELFDPSRCHLASVSYDTARSVIAEAHYIGRPGSTSVSLGMYVDNVIAGVITFGTIPKNNASSVCGPLGAPHVMELTRLALYDWPPTNSESWFIAQAVRWLSINRPDVMILVSYADQAHGHVGTIYQATNWIYTGKTTGDVVYEQADGTILHPRTIGRMRGDLPAGKWRPSPTKHRYVTFLGSRTQRRALRRTLRWPSLDYPKGGTPPRRTEQ